MEYIEGPTLASGYADGTIKIWDRATGKEQRTLKGHAGAVQALVFAADVDAAPGRPMARLLVRRASVLARAVDGLFQPRRAVRFRHELAALRVDHATGAAAIHRPGGRRHGRRPAAAARLSARRHGRRDSDFALRDRAILRLGSVDSQAGLPRRRRRLDHREAAGHARIRQLFRQLSGVRRLFRRGAVQRRRAGLVEARRRHCGVGTIPAASPGTSSPVGCPSPSSFAQCCMPRLPFATRRWSNKTPSR